MISALVRILLRLFSRYTFGSPRLLESLQEEDPGPRSLNGCDSLLLPKILKDFPDFDAHMAKTYVRDQLQQRYGQRDSFRVHNVVICKYLPASLQKTVVFQAAFSYLENGRICQKRCELHYTYLLRGSTDTVAANCPNCGGALGYGVSVCPYCDSRVTNPMGSSWQFTRITET